MKQYVKFLTVKNTTVSNVALILLTEQQSNNNTTEVKFGRNKHAHEVNYITKTTL